MQLEQSHVKDTGLSFTCNTCGLTFPTADLQRLHMKSDWHRYNLKRRVAQLPPITSEMFAEKTLQQETMQRLEQEKTGRGSSGRSTGQRQVTKKDKKKEEKLLRKTAAVNLQNQKKREEKLRVNTNDEDLSSDDEQIDRPTSPTESMSSSTFSLGDPIEHDDNKTDDLHDMESIAEQDELDNEEEQEIKRRISRAVKIPPTQCFVDDKKFDTVEENVAYLGSKYGLFVPEKEYLTDLQGLIEYLGEKIGLGNMCLACSFQGRSLESVRQHMISKQHIRIPYESMDEKLEISDFYDFRGSYRARPVVSAADAANAEDAEEWEEVSGDEAMEDGEDEEFDEEDGMYVDETGYELSLPSGYRAGHRSLARYYSQNLRPSPIVREGQGTVLAVDKRAPLWVRDPAAAKEQKKVWAEQKKVENTRLRMTKPAKINFQKHFRDEMLQ